MKYLLVTCCMLSTLSCLAAMESSPVAKFRKNQEQIIQSAAICCIVGCCFSRERIKEHCQKSIDTLQTLKDKVNASPYCFACRYFDEKEEA